jgi:hypothetical protein
MLTLTLPLTVPEHTYTVNNILKVLPDPNFKVNAEHPFGYSNIFIYAYLKNKKYKIKFKKYLFVFFQSNQEKLDDTTQTSHIFKAILLLG